MDGEEKAYGKPIEYDLKVPAFEFLSCQPRCGIYFLWTTYLHAQTHMMQIKSAAPS